MAKRRNLSEPKAICDRCKRSVYGTVYKVKTYSYGRRCYLQVLEKVNRKKTKKRLNSHCNVTDCFDCFYAHSLNKKCIIDVEGVRDMFHV